jgi:hypothetical protein
MYNDPILDNPDIQKLLENADGAIARNLVSRWKAANYVPEDAEVYGQQGIGGGYSTSGEQRGTGFFNSMKAGYMIHGIVGTAQRKAKAFLGANDMIYDYQRVLPPTGKYINVDQWFKTNQGSLSDGMKAAYVRGDLDDLETEDQLYEALAYIGADDAYRADLNNSRGVSGFVGTTVGALGDPASLALTGGIGKLGAAGFGAVRQARNVALASKLAKASGQVATVSTEAGLLSRVAENVAVGLASTAAQESTLLALDEDRTFNESLENAEVGVLFDTLMATGFGILARRGLRSTSFVEFKSPDDGLRLSDIDNEVGNAIDRQNAPVVKGVDGQQLDLPRGVEEGLFGDVPVAKPKTKPRVNLKDIPPSTAKVEADATPILFSAQQRQMSFEEHLEIELKKFAQQQPPPDFTQGVKDMGDWVEDAMAEIEARKAARGSEASTPPPPQAAPTNAPGAAVGQGNVGQGQGATVPTGVSVATAPGGAATATPVGGVSPNRGYSKYQIHKPDSAVTRKVLGFLDKYGQNFVPWFAPMSKLEGTKSDVFAFLMHKIYRTRLPAIGVLDGSIRPELPFETRQANIVRKEENIKNTMTMFFKRSMKETDGPNRPQFVEDLIPEENWQPATQKRAAGYFDFVDAIRSSAGFESTLGKVNSAEQLFDVGLKKLREFRGDALVNQRIKDLGYAGKDADLKNHMVALFDAIVPHTEQMSQRLSRYPTNKMGSMYEDSLSVKLLHNDNSRMSANDFGRFWHSITSVGRFTDEPGSPRNVDYIFRLVENRADLEAGELDSILRFYSADMVKSTKVGLSESDIQYLLLNPNATDNRAYSLVARMRDHYMNHYGGYVPPGNGHEFAAKFRLANGSYGVQFDARQSIDLHSRAVEQVELGITLKDAIKEASEWDASLRDTVSNAKLLEEYDSLNANIAYGVNQGGIDMDFSNPSTYGFINGIKEWNNKALDVFRSKIMEDELPSLRLDPAKYAQFKAEFDSGSMKWLDKEKNLIDSGFKHIKQRTGLELELPETAAEQTAYNIITPVTRNLLLTNRLFNNSLDVASQAYAAATSVFKGDIGAMARGALLDFDAAQKRGISANLFIRNVEYLNQNANSLAIRYYNDSTHIGNVGTGSSLPDGTPDISRAERFAAMQSGPVAQIIDHASLGRFTQEFSRGMAAASTMFQLFDKEGLVLRFDRALDDMAGGMSQANAFKKQGLNNYWGLWARQYLNDTDIREAAALLKANQTTNLEIPLRWGLSKRYGTSSIRVIDLPEGATVAQRTAIENLAVFANDLITKEKMAHPGWLDDITGSNNTLKRIVTFWMRPAAAAFNRLFVAGSLKGDKTLAGIFVAMTATAVVTDVVKAEVTGRGAEKWEQINEGWIGYVAGRGAWTSVFGVQGEKMLNWSGVVPGAVRSGNGTGVVPWDVFTQTAGTGRNLASVPFGGKLTDGDINRIWRMGNLVGIPSNTLGARLLGETGRNLGIYGEDNDAVDIQASFKDALKGMTQ